MRWRKDVIGFTAVILLIIVVIFSTYSSNRRKMQIPSAKGKVSDHATSGAGSRSDTVTSGGVSGQSKLKVVGRWFYHTSFGDTILEIRPDGTGLSDKDSLTWQPTEKGFKASVTTYVQWNKKGIIVLPAEYLQESDRLLITLGDGSSAIFERLK